MWRFVVLEPGGGALLFGAGCANRHRVVIVLTGSCSRDGMRAGTSARSIPVIEKAWGEFPGLKVIGSSE